MILELAIFLGLAWVGLCIDHGLTNIARQIQQLRGK